MASPSRVVFKEDILEIVNNSKLKLSETELSGDSERDGDCNAPIRDVTNDFTLYEETAAGRYFF